MKTTFLALAVSSLLLSCEGGSQYPIPAPKASMNEDLAYLKDKRIYFAHQSVGKNILAGLTDLMGSGPGALRLVDLQQASVASSPGLYHDRVGSNTDPQSKCEAFSRFMTGAAASGFDLAVLKFCYVDVNRGRDLAPMLESYKRALEGVRRDHPGTVILHVTVPLKAAATGRLASLKRLAGIEDPTDQDNIRRTEYNELLKKTFPGEPIFDLAAVESTYPDGKRESFQAGGKTHYRLIAALSNDGGHLNDAGRRVAAEAMVRSLAASLRGHEPARD